MLQAWTRWHGAAALQQCCTRLQARCCARRQRLLRWTPLPLMRQGGAWRTCRCPDRLLPQVLAWHVALALSALLESQPCPLLRRVPAGQPACLEGLQPAAQAVCHPPEAQHDSHAALPAGHRTKVCCAVQPRTQDVSQAEARHGGFPVWLEEVRQSKWQAERPALQPNLLPSSQCWTRHTASSAQPELLAVVPTSAHGCLGRHSQLAVLGPVALKLVRVLLALACRGALQRTSCQQSCGPQPSAPGSWQQPASRGPAGARLAGAGQCALLSTMLQAAAGKQGAPFCGPGAAAARSARARPAAPGAVRRTCPGNPGHSAQAGPPSQLSRLHGLHTIPDLTAALERISCAISQQAGGCMPCH